MTDTAADPDLRGSGLLRPGLRGEARRPPAGPGRDPRHHVGQLQGQPPGDRQLRDHHQQLGRRHARVQVQRPDAVRSRASASSCAMGYRGALRTMIKGEITSLRPSFPAGGGSTLAISGLNLLHRFRTQQESHTYASKTDSEIAAGDRGRLKVTDRGAERAGRAGFKYLIQDNQYDIIFLMERARRIGYDLFVEEGDGSASTEPSSSTAVDQVHHPTYRLTYGKSLIEFQPELTTANQVGQGHRARLGQRPEGSDRVHRHARRDRRPRASAPRGGQDEIDKSVEQKAEIIATKPVESEAEARKLAIEILEGIAKDMVKATGSVPGLPDMRAGTVLRDRRRRRPLQRPLLRRLDHARHRRQRLHHAVRMPARGALSHAARERHRDRHRRRISTIRRQLGRVRVSCRTSTTKPATGRASPRRSAARIAAGSSGPRRTTRCWWRASKAIRGAPTSSAALWSKVDPPPADDGKKHREQLAVLPLALRPHAEVRRHRRRRADRDHRQGRQAASSSSTCRARRFRSPARAATSSCRRRAARCRSTPTRSRSRPRRR